jgi:hypothetical protein
VRSMILRCLLAQGRTVRTFDSFVVGRRANLEHNNGNSNLTIIGGDVAEAGAVAAATAGVKRVFHLAAHVGSVTSAIGSAGHGDGRGGVVCQRFFSPPSSGGRRAGVDGSFGRLGARL